MKTFVPLVACLLFALAVAPFATASSSVQICDPYAPDAVHRAECAAYATAQGVLKVAQPLVDYADGEVVYYDGVVCAVVDHEIGGHPCWSLTSGLLAA